MKTSFRSFILLGTSAAAVVFSIALGVISYLYYVKQNQTADFFRKEEAGVEVANAISQLMLREGFDFESQTTKMGSVDNATVDALCDQVQNALPTTTVQQSRLMNICSKASGKRDHFTSLGIFKEIQFWALDNSNLILDPDFETYHLIYSNYVNLTKFLYFMPFSESLYDDQSVQSFDYSQRYGIGLHQLVSYSEALQKVLEFGSINEEQKQTLTLAFNDLNSLQEGTRNFFEQQDLQQRKDSAKIISEKINSLLAQTSQVVLQLNRAKIEAAEGALQKGFALTIFLALVSVALILVTIKVFIETSSAMQGLIRSQREALNSAQKLATMGELSAGIGHDIANPLTVIIATTHSLEKILAPQDPELLKYTARLKRMADRINAIIRSMKSFMTDETSAPAGPVSLEPVFEDVLLLTKYRASKSDVEVSVDLSNIKNQVLGAESDLIQLFVNLTCNAIDAVQNSPVRKIEIQGYEEGNAIKIAVQDSGPGVPQEYREKIFQALFTTKAKGEGTGLGLSICQKIVNRYQGKISLVDSEQGARFEVTLLTYNDSCVPSLSEGGSIPAPTSA